MRERQKEPPLMSNPREREREREGWNTPYEKKDTNNSSSSFSSLPQTAPSLSILLRIFLLYLLGGVCIFWLLEPTWGIWDAFYFVVVTLSTVGYGDQIPSHALCKVVSGPSCCCHDCAVIQKKKKKN